MKRVGITALAEFDLAEAQDFYAQAGDWVVDHFLNCIDEALSALATTAGIHPVRFGHHRVGVPHFPFSVYYDVEGEDVVVKAVPRRPLSGPPVAGCGPRHGRCNIPGGSSVSMVGGEGAVRKTTREPK